MLLRGLLRLHHYRVIGEAEGATDALELLRTHLPTVLVVDATLAEGSFPALVREARSLHPSLRVVLVSATPVRSLTPAEKLEHPDAVVRRPFRLAEFLTALRGGPPGAP